MTPEPDTHTHQTRIRLRPSLRAWVAVFGSILLTAGCLIAAFLSDPGDRSIFLLCSCVGLFALAWSVWRIRSTIVLVGPDWVEVRTPLTGRTRLGHAEILEIRPNAASRSPATLWVRIILTAAIAAGVGLWAYGMFGLGWGLVVLLGWAAELDRGRSAGLTLVASEGRTVFVPGWLEGVGDLKLTLQSPGKAASIPVP